MRLVFVRVMTVEQDSRLTRHRWESECNVGVAMTEGHFPGELAIVICCAVRLKELTTTMWWA